MPQEHAPMPERMRNDPNVRDDPLRQPGRRQHHAPRDAGHAATASAAGRQEEGQEGRGRRQGRDEGRLGGSRGQDGQGRQGGREGPRADRHRRARRLHQEGGRGTTPTSSASWSTSPSRRPTNPSAPAASATSSCGSCTPIRPTTSRKARTSTTCGASPTRATATWRRSIGLREKHKADVALLIVDDAKGCGLATRVYADADEAFAVVHHECAATSYTVAHEIGHLIGARHDLALDKNMKPFPYGHGYVNGQQVARHHELQGQLRRLPAHPRVVEPADHGQGRGGRHARARQRPRHRRAGQARRQLPLTPTRPRPTRTRPLQLPKKSSEHAAPHKQDMPACASSAVRSRAGGN